MLHNTTQDRLTGPTIRQLLVFHVIAIFLIAVVTTCLFWAVLPAALLENASTDYVSYYEPVARNILSGVGLVRSDGVVAINNPPGYSVLLASLFSLAGTMGLPDDQVYSAFVLFCMGIASIFVFLLSQENWGTRGGWLSALFFMSYPFVLWLTKQRGTEMPFMAAFYASLYLFWTGLRVDKYAWLFMLLAGVFVGAAMLIRGIAVGAGILLCGLLLFLKRNSSLKVRLFLALILFLGNLLVVLPWQVWVYQQTGQVILLGTNGVPSVKDGLTFAVKSKNYRQEIQLPEDVVQLQRNLVDEDASMTSLSKILQTLERHFEDQPLTVGKLFLIKAVRSWYGTDSGRMETAILFVQLLYGVLILLATIALWHRRFQYSGTLIFVWGLAAYFWCMTILVLSILRYMAPTIGLFALLVPGVIDFLPRRLRFFC